MVGNDDKIPKDILPIHERLLQNLSVSAEILPWSTLGALFRIGR